MVDSISVSLTADLLRVQINFYNSGRLVADFFGTVDSFRVYQNENLDFLFLYGAATQRLFLYLSESCFYELHAFVTHYNK